MIDPTLTCKTCGETKPVFHFHQRASSKTGYAPSYRVCVNEKRQNTKPSPAATRTQLMNVAKKGDLDTMRPSLAGTPPVSLDSLLNACVTPYVSFPKKSTHPDLARFLITRGADPNARGTQGEPMLSLAAKSGVPELVQSLLQGGANLDFFTGASILDASEVERWLRSDPSLATAADHTGLTGLHYCAGSALGRVSEAYVNKQLATIGLLLEAGSHPNHEVDQGIAITPLVACCTSGGVIPVIHRLVDAGANANHPNALRSALRHFKQKRSAQNPVADALIDRGCDVDGLIDADRTCLHAYSHHEETQAVRWLLERGASVHARTSDGRTPLHLAADRNNHTSVVKLLLEQGAEPDATDTLGRKPIDYAQSNDKTKVAALLRTK